MSAEDLGPRQRAAATKRRRSIRRIIEAARILFDERGWHGVTLDEIAEAAGLSKATFYYHFATKRTLALAAYAPLLRPIMEDAQSALAEPMEARLAGKGRYRFIHDLAKVVVTYPVVAIALLDIGQSADEAQRSCEHGSIGLDQLADQLGSLLYADGHWQAENLPLLSYPTGETAKYYLLGMLTWVLQHPRQSAEEVAAFVDQLIG